MRNVYLAMLLGSFWFASPAAGQIFATLQEAQPPVAGTAPEVETAPNRLQRRLEQVETLITDELWDEAINTLEEAQLDAASADDAPGGYLFEQEPGYYLPLAKVCQLRLANLPAAGLKVYRQRVDALAEEWFLEAREQRDEAKLRRIVDEFFASSWADDALELLGQIALERGDYIAARRCWREVHPWLSSPDGRPLAGAVAGIDLEQNANAVRKLIQAPSPQRLGYPDTDLEFAPLMAGMILASLYEGDTARAAIEIRLLELLASDAVGPLGGRSQPLAPALSQLLAESKGWPSQVGAITWPTIRGNTQRNGAAASVGNLAGSLWPKPYLLPQLTPPVVQQDRRFAQLLQAVGTTQTNTIPSVVVDDGKILLSDQSAALTNSPMLRCLDFLTGTPTGAPDGILYQQPATNASPINRQRNLIRFNGRVMAMPGMPKGSPSPHLEKGIAYAVVPADSTRRQANRRTVTQSKIVGMDLRRDGLTMLELTPPELPWRFGGPPVVQDGMLYVALAADDVRPRVAIACYAIATAKQVWQVEVCSGQPAANYNGTSLPPNLLTLGDDTIYCNTNLGAIAALSTKTGSFRWVRFYDRITSGSVRSVANLAPAGSPPCTATLADGRLYLAPSDADTLFALDASTGRLLWVRDQPDQEATLLGISQDRLVLGGRQLTILNAANGKQQSIWPESPKAGLRGAGRGCLAGNEVFWPTRDRLFTFDLTTGQQSRQSIDLTPYGDDGANVLPAYGCLIVVGNKALTVLGPVNMPPPEPPMTLSSTTPSNAEFVSTYSPPHFHRFNHEIAGGR